MRILRMLGCIAALGLAVTAAPALAAELMIHDDPVLSLGCVDVVAVPAQCDALAIEALDDALLEVAFAGDDAGSPELRSPLRDPFAVPVRLGPDALAVPGGDGFGLSIG